MTVVAAAVLGRGAKSCQTLMGVSLAAARDGAKSSSTLMEYSRLLRGASTCG
jgi:hypothetical protein